MLGKKIPKTFSSERPIPKKLLKKLSKIKSKKDKEEAETKKFSLRNDCPLLVSWKEFSRFKHQRLLIFIVDVTAGASKKET